ncbi:hypothetical protein CGRA01v4_05374 [Colletotrichum graminicola]|nr:hypothetical protein CGRA01v4_05374 [Colletotrichum graminicola]
MSSECDSLGLRLPYRSECHPIVNIGQNCHNRHMQTCLISSTFRRSPFFSSPGHTKLKTHWNRGSVAILKSGLTVDTGHGSTELYNRQR